MGTIVTPAQAGVQKFSAGLDLHHLFHVPHSPPYFGQANTLGSENSMSTVIRTTPAVNMSR